jgi:hypothetical protein
MTTLREGMPDAPMGPGLTQGPEQNGHEAPERAGQQPAGAEAWQRLLDLHLPAGEPVVVLATPASGSFEAPGRPVVGLLPETGGGAAGVARLEAQRVQGIRFALVPAAARPHVAQDAHLAQHLGAHFRVLAEDPEIGTVFEWSTPASGTQEAETLGDLIESLCPRDHNARILDWTSHGMADFLPGWTLIRPVEPGVGALPYLDNTIEVVLVDDAARMDEAQRVAAGVAVLVSTDGSGAIAAETRHIGSERAPAPAPVLVLVTTHAGDDWLGRLSEVMSARPDVEIRAAADPLPAGLDTDAPTVVLAERGVLPLSQCIEAAERLLALHPRVGGVAVKLFDAAGLLEAAGGAAFADGSVEGIARGATPMAPWHEYVRPVPAALGLVVLRSAAARECAFGPDLETLDPAGLSARLWSSGWELRYQPEAAAVRAFPAASAGPGVWPLAPDGLPARPGRLHNAAWRRLLAREEVGAIR